MIMTRSVFYRHLTAIACLVGSVPSVAIAQDACQLCGDPQPIAPAASSNLPLRITITSDLDFDRMALVNNFGGSAYLDPQTGQLQLTQLVGVGNMPARGSVLLTGDPGAAVEVELPTSVRLSGPGGAQLDLINVSADLPAQPRLDANGELRFSFGGTVEVDGHDIGLFNGRVRIKANYDR
jgi:hypothetical protein